MVGIDKDSLKQMALAAKPSVVVMGLGGAGCNITTWIAEKGMAGGRIVAANTDVNHLTTLTKADKLILLGEKLCKGHGCGGYPEKGAQAAKENIAEIKAELEGANLLFLVGGLGGGTGTGAMPVVAEAAREMGILTIGCVTIPFTIEMSRREKAREAVKLLAENCDSVVIIDNSKLREVAGNLPLKEALNVANALVGAFVKNITDTITQPSLVNLDYADLRAVLESGGISSIGIGEGDGNDRVNKAVSKAISTPLLDVSDLSASFGVLIHIIGGEDLTLEEVAVVGEQIMAKVPNTKRVIWGAKVDNGLTGKVRVMAVLTGVQSPFVTGKEAEKLRTEKRPEPVFEKKESKFREFAPARPGSIIDADQFEQYKPVEGKPSSIQKTPGMRETAGVSEAAEAGEEGSIEKVAEAGTERAQLKKKEEETAKAERKIKPMVEQEQKQNYNYIWLMTLLVVILILLYVLLKG